MSRGELLGIAELLMQNQIFACVTYPRKRGTQFEAIKNEGSLLAKPRRKRAMGLSLFGENPYICRKVAS